jgi:hypothetical protein
MVIEKEVEYSAVRQRFDRGSQYDASKMVKDNRSNGTPFVLGHRS